MKERPILFSAPMVRALMDGSKTQTRRIAKEIPYGPDADHYGTQIMDWGLSGVYQDETNSSPDRWWLDIQTEVDENSHREISCPYGQPGDRLWVKEKCSAEASDTGPDGIRFAADGYYQQISTNQHQQWAKLHVYGGGFGKQVSSIHMPRWASRITLEITGVRVERLQDISESDAKAEGIDSDAARTTLSTIGMREISGPVAEYSVLWESLNGDGSWEANPWVWVVEFKKQETSNAP